ncbi:hypothetical protein INT43_006364 [Umbelopsis isabellina]|uniref:Uncharacterized protein n=1 Tax=Mortierella isabellina TaxID=91625 RepID=A0A8H7PZ31_MORIS|nr:hypothetical protein INT43_006364 [Umbelopsis isabellina]
MTDAVQIANEIADRFDASPKIRVTQQQAEDAINEASTGLQESELSFSQICKENERINAILDNIRQQSSGLQDTFDQIDDLEKFINHVANTFNQVSDSVSSMERSVMTSSGLSMGPIPMSFKFLSGPPTNVDAQTYFPPPGEVDIADTSKFFSSEKNNV